MENRCEKHEKFRLDGGCPSNTCEEAAVTLPVEVRAFADVGDVELMCLGPVVVRRNSSDTPGRPCAVSKFTISQRMRVIIPVTFNAEADIGESHVEFEPCSDPCKCDCGE